MDKILKNNKNSIEQKNKHGKILIEIDIKLLISNL